MAQNERDVAERGSCQALGLTLVRTEGSGETAGKSGKQIERCAIARFRVAESMGFKGDFRQWEDLLEIGD